MKILCTFRKNLDVPAYQKCIDKNTSYAAYANANFLDSISANSWAVLHTEDYKTVMPVPFEKKLGIRVVYMPIFCQQLGVWSEGEPVQDAQILQAFYHKLRTHFLVRNYQFHALNSLALPKKLNLYLPSNDFSSIFQNFKPQRRNKIRKFSADITVKEIDFTLALEFLKVHLKQYDTANSVYQKQLSNLEVLQKKGFLSLYGGYFQDTLIQVNVLLELGKRKIMLINCSHPLYQKKQAASVVVSAIIEKYCEDFIFDFEGSSLPKVQEFFMGFSPKEEYFAMIEKSWFHAFKDYFYAKFK